jgi:hypothetical protein
MIKCIKNKILRIKILMTPEIIKLLIKRKSWWKSLISLIEYSRVNPILTPSNPLNLKKG